MGAGHGKDEGGVSPIPPPASIGALRGMLNSPNGDGTQKNTLEKSLKHFLKKYNMSGLEYRLRLAGIYTLADLNSSNETILSQHGFTLLMARRLYRALDSYIEEFEESPDYVLTASAKRKQSRKYSASVKKLKSGVNFGKQNKRRAASAKASTTSTSTGTGAGTGIKGIVKGTGSPIISRKISVTPPTTYTPTVIGVSPINFTDDSNRSPHSPNSLAVDVIREDTSVDDVTTVNDDVTTVNDDVTTVNDDVTTVNDDATRDVTSDAVNDVTSGLGPSLEPLGEEDVQDDLDDDVELPLVVVQRASLPNNNQVSQGEHRAKSTEDLPLLHSPIPLDHHISMPLGLDKIDNEEPSNELWQPEADSIEKSLSCPCLAALDDGTESPETEEKQMDEFHEILSALRNHEVRDVEELLMYLHTILDFLKYSCLRDIEPSFGTICDIISFHLHNLVVVEVCVRILRYLTGNHAHKYSTDNRELIEKVVTGTLNVIKAHPFSKRCQVNGCLVLNNIFRSGHVTDIDVDYILSVLSTSLENYQKDEAVSLGILTAMVSVLSSVSNSLSTVSQQLQLCLVQLCVLMDTFGDNVQILQFVLSFFTLSLINVAALVDDSIMRSMMDLTQSVLVTHKEKADIVVYVCKTVSQMAPHKLIEEEDISTELADGIVEVLSLHPKSSGVQTWGSYALYQLSSYNNSLIPYVKNSGCIERRKCSLPHLNNEARSYIEQLAQLATL